MIRSRVALLLCCAQLGCQPDRVAPSATSAPGLPSGSDPSGSSVLAPVSVETNVYPAPARLIAFGDVHGDLDAAKRALRLAGAIDDSGTWIGGDLFVVQVGDQIDRGDDDRAVLDLFEKLHDEAAAAGGHFLALNGNHELMNANLDFSYVTSASKKAFAEFGKDAPASLSRVPENARGRAFAFGPGGPYAKQLAKRPLFAIVGESVFVHGGLLPKHLQYGLDKMDRETRAFLEGTASRPPQIVVAEDGPVWTRLYSAQVGENECRTLRSVLGALSKTRMVMGHTPQKPGISLACDGQAVRIDTGMSAYYKGSVEVLEIVADQPKILK